MYVYRLRSSLFVLLLSVSAILLQGCIAAAAGGAATGAAVVTDRRTTGTLMDDKTAEVKAIHLLSLDKHLWRESHITVVSYNNVLLLVGQTPTEEFKQKASEIVSEIPKVRQIHNELEIESPASLGSRTSDTWITTQVKTKLLGTKQISASRIKVITENGVVYLMGLVTPEEETIATDIARAVKGVDKVIQIFEPFEPKSDTATH